jgi:hypothetical protein
MLLVAALLRCTSNHQNAAIPESRNMFFCLGGGTEAACVIQEEC